MLLTNLLPIKLHSCVARLTWNEYSVVCNRKCGGYQSSNTCTEAEKQISSYFSLVTVAGKIGVC